MAIIDCDAMAFENGIHFADDGCAAGFNAVEGEHGDDVVGEDFVGVDDGLMFVHGAEVDALGEDDEVGAFGAGGGIAGFFFAEGAGSDAGDGLDNGGAAGSFDVVEHDYLGDGDVVLFQ